MGLARPMLAWILDYARAYKRGLPSSNAALKSRSKLVAKLEIAKGLAFGALQML